MYTTTSDLNIFLYYMYFIFYVYEYFACMYVYVYSMHARCPWKSEKCVGTLELELQKVVSCLVGAGNKNHVL